MKPRARRWILRAGLALVSSLLGAVLLLVLLVRASLPPLDGRRTVDGTERPVTIERDAYGVPTLHAGSRADLAYATGFVHGQDRFFQMDLTRRAAAGELSELLGPLAREYDARVRVHRFRWRAGRALERGDPQHATLLAAYARGVNAGRRSLGARPFEYFALRSAPVDWRAEDCFLVLYSMYLDLQDEGGARESTRGLLRDVLGDEAATFLWPAGTQEWDAPIEGEALPQPPVPGPETLDLRGDVPAPAPGVSADVPERGSNNWAIAGSLTAHGGAMLANDMHLGLGAPNIWYRVMLTWEEDGADHRAVGVTLPGAPALVVGSNGRVAWGFTNSYGDYGDLVVLEVDPDRPERYRTPSGWRFLEHHEEILRAKGAPPETLRVRETIWGPVVDRDHRGRPRVLRWVAHDAVGANLNLLRLERVITVEEALDVANLCGVPAQNFVAADREGHIGWTVLGRVPRRVGFDGSVPTSWSDGACGWDGFLEPKEVPRIVDPPEGRIWTANARVVGGQGFERIGDGGYALGARAQQIRDDLRALDRPSEGDLLVGVQLDDRAVFLARWQLLLLATLEGDSTRDELRVLVEQWGARASVESAGYRFVRAFRRCVHDLVLGALTARCVEADSSFSTAWMPRAEGPVWALITQRPAHLLPPRYATWDELLGAAVDDAVASVTDGQRPLASFRWGERNLTRIQHPLSRAVPALGRWLDMTPRELPGDSYMPRVQHPSSGASERMVVSPGREEEGIFHMPGGQSGHFLSPYYRDGHVAWEEGRPTPLLPGPAQHELGLRPRASGPP